MEVLDYDEDKVYTSLIINLDPHVKWGKDCDQDYFNACQDTWLKQKAKIQAHLA